MGEFWPPFCRAAPEQNHLLLGTGVKIHKPSGFGSYCGQPAGAFDFLLAATQHSDSSFSLLIGACSLPSVSELAHHDACKGDLLKLGVSTQTMPRGFGAILTMTWGEIMRFGKHFAARSILSTSKTLFVQSKEPAVKEAARC